jgi:hypothetical protein
MPAPDGFHYIHASQFALEETMEASPEYLSDGMNDDDNEPPQFTVPTMIKGFIDRVDTTYQVVRQLQRLSKRLESKANG